MEKHYLPTNYLDFLMGLDEDFIDWFEGNKEQIKYIYSTNATGFNAFVPLLFDTYVIFIKKD